AHHTIVAIFVSNCLPTTSTTNATVCANALPYSWNSNSYNAAGSYIVHFTNAKGCDSAATLNLTVTNNPSSGQLYSKYGYTNNITLCTLESFSVYPDVKGGVWSSADSNIVSTIKQPGSTSSIVFKPQNAGTVKVNYITSNTGVGACPNVSSILVIVAPQALPAAISGASKVCVGATANYTTASTGGVWSVASRATINASGVATGTSAGNTAIVYTVTNAAGCSASSSLNVTINALPAIPTFGIVPGTPSITGSGGYCKNKTFNVVGNPAGGTWSSSGSFAITNLGVVTTAATPGVGSVSYAITNANGCTSSRTISANVVTCSSKGINNQMAVSNEQLVVYPNPAHSTINLNVRTLVGRGSIVVTDLYGKQLKTQTLSMGTNTIDVSSFAKGMYMVSVITETGKQTQKVVVE
ncbi:MAG: T9SS type A sorting domain-containing protein, partial [Bacteroidetes bacterium]|nr:T9SS type A sorting domain-containing protein [Bacteroidota bacterium]